MMDDRAALARVCLAFAASAETWLLERPRGLDMEASAIDVAPVVRGV
jgi:hypothetical protein